MNPDWLAISDSINALTRRLIAADPEMMIGDANYERLVNDYLNDVHNVTYSDWRTWQLSGPEDVSENLRARKESGLRELAGEFAEALGDAWSFSPTTKMARMMGQGLSMGGLDEVLGDAESYEAMRSDHPVEAFIAEMVGSLPVSLGGVAQAVGGIGRIRTATGLGRAKNRLAQIAAIPAAGAAEGAVYGALDSNEDRVVGAVTGGLVGGSLGAVAGLGAGALARRSARRSIESARDDVIGAFEEATSGVQSLQARAMRSENASQRQAAKDLYKALDAEFGEITDPATIAVIAEIAQEAPAAVTSRLYTGLEPPSLNNVRTLASDLQRDGSVNLRALGDRLSDEIERLSSTSVALRGARGVMQREGGGAVALGGPAGGTFAEGLGDLNTRYARTSRKRKRAPEGETNQSLMETWEQGRRQQNQDPDVWDYTVSGFAGNPSDAWHAQQRGAFRLGARDRVLADFQKKIDDKFPVPTRYMTEVPEANALTNAFARYRAGHANTLERVLPESYDDFFQYLLQRKLDDEADRLLLDWTNPNPLALVRRVLGGR